MNTNTYYVWRRNDGYVHATCGSKPSNWTYWTCVDGSRTTFEHLGEFNNWPDAYNLIAKLREEGNYEY